MINETMQRLGKVLALGVLCGLVLGGAPTFAAPTKPADASSRVNVNTASAGELARLPGIGPSKAQAIVEFRAKNGAFKSVDDLEKVPGIGAATIAKNRDNLTVSGGKASKGDKAAAKKDGKKDASKD